MPSCLPEHRDGRLRDLQAELRHANARRLAWRCNSIHGRRSLVSGSFRAGRAHSRVAAGRRSAARPARRRGAAAPGPGWPERAAGRQATVGWAQLARTVPGSADPLAAGGGPGHAAGLAARGSAGLTARRARHSGHRAAQRADRLPAAGSVAVRRRRAGAPERRLIGGRARRNQAAHTQRRAGARRPAAV